MYKFKFLWVLLFAFSVVMAQKNPLIDGKFWKQKPTIEKVQQLLEKGYKIDAKGHHNMDVLSYALAGGVDVSLAKFLIEKQGFDPIKKTSWQPPVFFAASSGNLKLVKYLIQKGVDPKDKSRSSSLFLALIQSGNTSKEVFDFFEKQEMNLKYDLDRFGRTALLIAAQKMKGVEDLEIFEKHDFNFNATDTMGNGLFYYATRSGSIPLLKHLVEKGYYYGENFHNGDNAFTFVTQRSRGAKPVTIPVLEYLKSLGLNPAKINKKRNNALLNMVFSVDDPKIWKFFLDAGADANLQGSRGIPLIPASYRRKPAVLKLLLSKTKNINTQNDKGMTALMIAVGYNTPEVVKFLLENGADTKVVDKKGHGAGGHLVTHYRRDIDKLKAKMTLLQKYGYNAKYKQPDGSTLLHLAAKKNKPELVSYILSLGIKINAKDNNGYTALHKAAMTAKNLKTLKLLIKKGAKKKIQTELDETVYDLAMENELLAKQQNDLKFLK